MHASRQASDHAVASSPFSLANGPGYQRWRAQKLNAYPASVAALLVEIGDLARPTPSERRQLRRICAKTNMVLYACARPVDKAALSAFAHACGLARLSHNPLADDDGVSSVRVDPRKGARGYIPYTDKRLSWHTDGYYNDAPQAIRAFVLHCVTPAAEGGENALLDPEIAYLELRDAEPEYVRALMHDEAMTIPANTEGGEATRGACTGPVFSVDVRGNLHMRYTARTRSIVWRDDAATRAAVSTLERLLAADADFVFRHTLEAGQGLLCNNVLHNRAAFADAPGAARLIYRARYYDRVAGTDWTEATEDA